MLLRSGVAAVGERRFAIHPDLCAWMALEQLSKSYLFAARLTFFIFLWPARRALSRALTSAAISRNQA